MDEAQINYARSLYDPIIKVSKEGNSSKIELQTEINGLDLYYTFDNTYPDKFSARYNGKILDVPKNATYFKVISYRNGKPIGQRISIKL